MSVIRARAVNQGRSADWAEAKATAGQMVDLARDFDGVHYYEMYVDEAEHRLVNLAEYADEAAWRAWIQANRPLGSQLMTTVDVIAMEVYGELSPELRASIMSYTAATTYPRLAG
ncbi:antibiotic biosynthesis monooxygenase [Nocardioides humi]|uniref:ABM domain-containing protein n=1 Tax=Nocardioides humi TaxID=449461 RepID=A0ABN2BFT3_9ACTN|nr:antibiotic biosynthesis monooxygenase [Nocardioides humi]